MEEINDDIIRTIKILSLEKDDSYSKIYMNSNEELYKIFKSFSVKDRKVLTVLSSSDQFFLCHYLGAKRVDSFDCNKICEYYFYLRKWLFKYKNYFFSLRSNAKINNKLIEEVLRLVDCSNLDEERAYNYWCSFIRKGLSINELFFDDIYDDSLEKLISNMLVLKEIVESVNLNFRYQDISADIDKKRKYNIVILSNLLEYYSMDYEKLKRCRDNLYEILEDDGEVICTNMVKHYTSTFEKNIFKEKFGFNDFSFYRKDFSRNYPVGYSYIKK